MSEAQTWRNFIKVNTVKKKIKVNTEKKPIFNARPKSCFSVTDNIKFIHLISANTSIVDPNLNFTNKEQNYLWDAIGEQLNKSGNIGNDFLNSLTNEELRCRYICAAHFPPSMIHHGKRSRLIGPAVPVSFQSHASEDKNTTDTFTMEIGSQCRTRWRQLRSIYRHNKEKSPSHKQYYLMSSLRKLDAFLIAKRDLTKKQNSNAPKIQKFDELSDGTLSSSSSAAVTDIVKLEEDTFTDIVKKDKTPTIIVKEEDDSFSIDNTWLNHSSAVQNDGSLVGLADEDNIIKDVNKEEMEICANDVSTFTEYAQTVLRALPPKLRVLAKRDLFEVLHKYEVINIGEA